MLESNSTKALFTTKGTAEDRKKMLSSAIAEVEYSADTTTRKLACDLSRIAFGIYSPIDSLEHVEELLDQVSYDKLLPKDKQSNKFLTSLVDMTQWWLEGIKSELPNSPGLKF